MSAPLPPKQRSYSCWEVFTQEDITIPAHLNKMARLHFGVYFQKGVVILSLKAALKLLKYEIHEERVLFSDDDIAVSIRKNSYSDRTIQKVFLCDFIYLE